MVDRDGRVKVLDFGLAKVAEPREEAPADSELPTDLRTREGVVLGTVPYMSPEQVSGRPVDHRTDIFSLGVMLYEMATGKRPFGGASSVELLSSILKDKPPLLSETKPGLPPQLGQIVGRCLEKAREDRLQTTSDVLGELRALRKALDSGATASPSTGPERRPDSSPGRAEVPWIVVLPLKAQGADPELAAFADGLGEDITAGLSRFSQLFVISRHSVLPYTQRSLDVRTVGRELGARYALEGAVRKSGSAVRVSVQLLDATTGTHMWAETYDRDLAGAGIFEVQDDVTDRVVATVADPYGVLVRSMAVAVRDRPVEELSARELALRCSAYFHHIRPDEHARMRAALERKLEGEPKHAEAWAWLSRLYLPRARVPPEPAAGLGGAGTRGGPARGGNRPHLPGGLGGAGGGVLLRPRPRCFPPRRRAGHGAQPPKHERAGLHGRADQPRGRMGPRRRDHAAFDGAQPSPPGLVSLPPVLRSLPEARVRRGAGDDEADEHARGLLDPRRDRCRLRPAGPEGRGPRRARFAAGPPARLPRGAGADPEAVDPGRARRRAGDGWNRRSRGPGRRTAAGRTHPSALVAPRPAGARGRHAARRPASARSLHTAPRPRRGARSRRRAPAERRASPHDHRLRRHRQDPLRDRAVRSPRERPWGWRGFRFSRLGHRGRGRAAHDRDRPRDSRGAGSLGSRRARDGHRQPRRAARARQPRAGAGRGGGRGRARRALPEAARHRHQPRTSEGRGGDRVQPAAARPSRGRRPGARSAPALPVRCALRPTGGQGQAWLRARRSQRPADRGDLPPARRAAPRPRAGRRPRADPRAGGSPPAARPRAGSAHLRRSRPAAAAADAPHGDQLELLAPRRAGAAPAAPALQLPRGLDARGDGAGLLRGRRAAPGARRARLAGREGPGARGGRVGALRAPRDDPRLRRRAAPRERRG